MPPKRRQFAPCGGSPARPRRSGGHLQLVQEDAAPDHRRRGLGDLAKEDLLLLELLHKGHLAPDNTFIWGYARSADPLPGAFHDRIRPNLESPPGNRSWISRHIQYFKGAGYGDKESWAQLNEKLVAQAPDANRLFYFAIPPSAFGPSGEAIKAHAMAQVGWNRLIIEKPFGKDSDSSRVLSDQLTALFTEDQIYRIDHYLGKDMVQNIISLRCSNVFLPRCGTASLGSVHHFLKEPIGTQGRGGYFDQYEIRDAMQNHLLQVLSLVVMDPPEKIYDANSVAMPRFDFSKTYLP